MIEKKLKIAIITSSLSKENSGGINTINNQLINILSEKYNLHIIAYSDVLNYQSKQKQVYRFKKNNFFTYFIKRTNNLIFKLIDPNTNAYHLSDILVSNLNFIKVFIFLKKIKPDVILSPDHGLPLLLSPIPNKSKVIHFTHHNPIRFLSIKETKPSKLDIKVSVWLEKLFLKKVNLVISPSKYMRDVFQKTFKTNININVIPNFINQTKPVKAISIKNKFKNKIDKVIYIPSGFNLIKGEQYLRKIIEKISQQTNFNIAFFISGKVSKIMLDTLRSDFNSNIFAPGKLKHNDLLSYVKSCDLCISPSLLESFGLAQFEAVNLGLPVIAFDVGGNRDFISKKCGTLIKKRDINKLINYSIQCLNNNERYCHSKIKHKYKKDSILKKYSNIFNTLIIKS